MSGQWPPEWDGSDTGLPDEWTDSDAELDPEASQVSLFLASVPSPMLPASFEARISAAIAAEATARADGTVSAGRVSASTESGGTESADAGTAVTGTDAAETTDRSSPPEFSPAVAEGGSATSARRRRRTSAASRGSARRSGPTGLRPDGRRRRFRVPSTAVTAPLLVLLVIAGFAFAITRFSGSGATYSGSVFSGTPAQGAASSTSGKHSTQAGRNAGPVPQFVGRPGESGPFMVIESGSRYQGSTLASQVRGQLNAVSQGAVTPAASVSNEASATVVASASATSPPSHAPSAELAGCVSHLTGGVTPRLVDQASYDGIPAYIIAVPSRVWVVRLGCTAADPQEIASVSLTGLFRESQRLRIG
jgi:hypothetical protein